MGRTGGSARDGAGHRARARPGLVFLHPLCRDARARLTPISTASIASMPTYGTQGGEPSWPNDAAFASRARKDHHNPAAWPGSSAQGRPTAPDKSGWKTLSSAAPPGNENPNELAVSM